MITWSEHWTPNLASVQSSQFYSAGFAIHDHLLHLPIITTIDQALEFKLKKD